MLTEISPVDAEFDTKLMLHVDGYILKTTHPAAIAVLQGVNRWMSETRPKGPPSAKEIAPFLPEPLDPALVDELLPNILGANGTSKRFPSPGAGGAGP